MSQEMETVLHKSLDAIDSFRRRVYAGGWVAVVFTLAAYAWFAYVSRTSNNLQARLGASVVALTGMMAWCTFAVILTITRGTKRILRAIELLSKDGR